MAANTKKYYDETASKYDELHGGDKNLEHLQALEKSFSFLDGKIHSVLDVGCGTGRTLNWYAEKKPKLELNGIDPSEGLLQIAQNRLPQAKFSVGQGETLPFDDASIDLVVATGIMHHVDHPKRVIQELSRVARKAVLISDHNNFAFGSMKARKLRLWLHASGLLSLFQFVKQGFRKQGYSQDDGWWYPYSIFNDYTTIAEAHTNVYVIPTRPANAQAGNLLLSLSHVAILVVKTLSVQEVRHGAALHTAHGTKGRRGRPSTPVHKVLASGTSEPSSRRN